MADGCYDLDGKCVNCGGYHPCNCEAQRTEYLTSCCKASMISADRMRDDGYLHETPVCANCGAEFPEMAEVLQ